MHFAFWIVVDLVIGVLMLIFGDPGTQFAGLAVIAICLLVVFVLLTIGLAIGVGWSVERLLPGRVAQLEALAVDLFFLLVLSVVIADLSIGFWNPYLVAYGVLQLPLAVFGRTAGQMLVGVSLVHTRERPRGLGGTLLEEAVLQLSVVQAVLITAVWLARSLTGPNRRSHWIEDRWQELATRERVGGKTHSLARGLAIVLALVLIGMGAYAMSLAPSFMADAARFNRAQACLGDESANPPTCLEERPATVLRVDHQVVRNQDGTVEDSLYYVQVSINGQPQSLLADTSDGTYAIEQLISDQAVTVGLWGGDLVLVRGPAGDIWAEGRRPGESGQWPLWIGLGIAVVGLGIGASARFWRTGPSYRSLLRARPS